jgi:hypothetical protein
MIGYKKQLQSYKPFCFDFIYPFLGYLGWTIYQNQKGSNPNWPFKLEFMGLKTSNGSCNIYKFSNDLAQGIFIYHQLNNELNKLNRR